MAKDRLQGDSEFGGLWLNVKSCCWNLEKETLGKDGKRGAL